MFPPEGKDKVENEKKTRSTHLRFVFPRRARTKWRARRRHPVRDLSGRAVDLSPGNLM